MTALDKQAREFEKLAKEYLWHAYPNAKDEFEEVAELVKLLTQVREQTVQECAGIAESEKCKVPGLAAATQALISEAIRALAAPPETTEQERK